VHIRTVAKLQALKEIGEGASDYRTFNRAASFGHIHHDDLLGVKGYQRGLRWVQSREQGDADPELVNKDHMVSRSWAYHNHRQVIELLTPELALALMSHVVKHGLKMEPRVNHALCLMALVVGHHDNCEVLPVRENSRKGAACSQTLAQLCEKISANGQHKPLGQHKP
jgi:hypothetical protein